MRPSLCPTQYSTPGYGLAVVDVAFICAMPMELEPISRKLGLAAADLDGLEVWSGTVESLQVAAIVTGMGPVLAEAGLNRLLESTEVDRVMVVGITGALEDETPIGTLVEPAAVVDAATGRRYRPHRSRADATGLMWTSDRLITDPAEVAELRELGVIALDMETAAIAAVCDRRGIPWSVHRAISDRTTTGLLDDELMSLAGPDGAPDQVAIDRYFSEHPERIEALAQLAMDATAAAEAAADAAIAACRSAPETG
jgi:adenosylhomocysteine nucleosidase